MSFSSHSFAICMSFVCQSYVLVCHVIYMSLLYVCKSSVCARMPFVCHLYLLVCRLYATRMYSYVIRMSLVCGFALNYIKCFTKNTKLWESLNIFRICDMKSKSSALFWLPIFFKLLSVLSRLRYYLIFALIILVQVP